MAGREHSKSGTGTLSRLNPLIGIELLRMEYLVIGNRIDSIILLFITIWIKKHADRRRSALPSQPVAMRAADRWEVDVLSLNQTVKHLRMDILDGLVSL